MAAAPRAPQTTEFPLVMSFLNQSLRPKEEWSIQQEYPTALTPSNIHNMRIIAEDEGGILSHAVLKPLIVRSPHMIFKVGAIGSVVTAPEARNQGYSSQIIDECLANAETQNCDVAILWTDIYEFYRRMGFELAGYEISFVIDRPLESKAEGLRFLKSDRVAPEPILKLYNQHSVAVHRSLEDIRKYLNIPQTQVYTAWDQKNQLVAYAIEGKGVDLKGYIHEWGGGLQEIVALLNFIQSQNAEITMMVPRHSQNLLAFLKTQRVLCNEGFLGMVKIVAHEQLFAKIKKAFRGQGIADFVLEKQEDLYVFGTSKNLITIRGEENLTRLLFGPINYADLNIFDAETLQKLDRLLPLGFWMWGWDSI